MTCEWCAHADEHGWWGRSGTHCRDCHMSWDALAESHCKKCYQQFSSNSIADKHDSYCTTDSIATAESLHLARSKAGSPVFALRERKGRKVWVSWSPDGSRYWEVAS